MMVRVQNVKFIILSTFRKNKVIHKVWKNDKYHKIIIFTVKI